MSTHKYYTNWNFLAKETLLDANQESWVITFKAVTLQVKVSVFLLFGVRINIQKGSFVITSKGGNKVAHVYLGKMLIHASDVMSLIRRFVFPFGQRF